MVSFIVVLLAIVVEKHYITELPIWRSVVQTLLIGPRPTRAGSLRFFYGSGATLAHAIIHRASEEQILDRTAHSCQRSPRKDDGRNSTSRTSDERAVLGNARTAAGGDERAAANIERVDETYDQPASSADTNGPT